MRNIELNNFVLPIVIQSDHQYLKTLETVLDDFLSDIHGRMHVDDLVFQQTVENKNKIIEAISHYLNADISKAQKCIYDILNNYVNDPFIVAELDNSIAFRGLTRLVPARAMRHPAAHQPIRMYKARKGIGNFDKSDFLHIPFNKRGNVSTQRFSIAGVPCMYFGLTSYVCWLELGKPPASEFNVSGYELPTNIKVLNLAIPQMQLNGMSTHEEFIRPVLSMIQLFPLVIATSFKVKEVNRSFRSEYIISQLVMQCLQGLEIDGVAYISKQVQNDSQNYPFCINLAVPMKNNPGKAFSLFAETLPLTNPINFAEYSHFVNPPTPARGNLTPLATCFDTMVLQYMWKTIRYENLQFSKLDDYLYNDTYDVINQNPNYP